MDVGYGRLPFVERGTGTCVSLACSLARIGWHTSIGYLRFRLVTDTTGHAFAIGAIRHLA